MKELKPCPFCGSTNLFEHGGYVECRDCAAYGPSRTSIPPKLKPGEIRTAADAWNMREGSPEPQVPYLMKKLNDERKEISDLKTELAASMPLPLDADGVPFRLGDAVYRLRDGQGLRVSVIEFREPECFIFAKADSTLIAGTYIADELTHKKPEPSDSWEKLEEDAAKTPCEYFGEDSCMTCNTGTEGCSEVKARDIVARAKRLAGVESA